MKSANKPFTLPAQPEKREYTYAEIREIVSQYHNATAETKNYINEIERCLQALKAEFSKEYSRGFEQAIFRFHYRRWHKLTYLVPYRLIESGKVAPLPFFKIDPKAAYSIPQLWEVYYNYRFCFKDEKRGIKQAIYKELTNPHLKTQIGLYWAWDRDAARFRFDTYDTTDDSFMAIRLICGPRYCKEYKESDIQVSDTAREISFDPGGGEFSFDELLELSNDQGTPTRFRLHIQTKLLEYLALREPDQDDRFRVYRDEESQMLYVYTILHDTDTASFDYLLSYREALNAAYNPKAPEALANKYVKALTIAKDQSIREQTPVDRFRFGWVEEKLFVVSPDDEQIEVTTFLTQLV